MPQLDFVKIAWFGKHFGEEPPLTGDRGAGTIFFTGCNLSCVYCQNYQLSRQGLGEKHSVPELASMMLELERQGAANIDLVSPTIWAKPISLAIREAKSAGLKLPIVWNSNAYESADLIKSLAGLVDIYLPDYKYSDDELALKYSGIKNYVKTAETAIREMFKQTGNLRLGKNGLARRGLLVRHLILPGQTENSLTALVRLKSIDENIFISLMSQYRPVYLAKNFPEINRRLNPREFEKVFTRLLELSLDNGWTQPLENSRGLLPDFRKAKPFG